MKKHFSFCHFVCLAIMLMLSLQGMSQTQGNDAQITTGVYYFDGWTGKTFHITKTLKDSFPERQSKWGWVTSTPEAMEGQIEAASGAGIDFFSFCWYYNAKTIHTDPKNNALKLYLKAKNKEKIDFSILVTNHKGYSIQKHHWDTLIHYWNTLFHDPSYIKVDSKPLITFYSVESLVTTFGSAEEVKEAIQRLMKKVATNGLKGVTVAACIDPTNQKTVQLAKECGFHVLTEYNHHNAGYDNKSMKLPIDSLIEKENRLRDKFLSFGLPCIPVATLNWDQRPCIDINPKAIHSPRYVGYSTNSVFKSVNTLKKWAMKHQKQLTKEQIVMLYAWNEYGEGAWLTPSMNRTENLLEGVHRALMQP